MKNRHLNITPSFLAFPKIEWKILRKKTLVHRIFDNIHLRKLSTAITNEKPDYAFGNKQGNFKGRSKIAFTSNDDDYEYEREESFNSESSPPSSPLKLLRERKGVELRA
ncbi:hypothetical protein NPIL_156771 [Nephila pilipes]|uniref:Uncharacterized protein n=1 Tax=Nephila pilipes TaxID=299642 RepID=A0A8X6NRZ8_NEPPI|nr:hypothetical protein NPIL_156771 [Nephila pilipes]